VTQAGFIDCAPLTSCAGSPIKFLDRLPARPGTEPMVGLHWITPSWPSVAGVPLVRGRMLTRDDDIGRRKVVLISEAAARAFWPNQDPIGHPVSAGNADTAYVVGVLGDVLYGSLDAAARPEVYVSYYQVPFTYRMMIFVKTRVDPSSLGVAVKRALGEVAPGFPVYAIRPFDDHVSVATSDARVSAMLLALFAALALCLAMMGTYGVISFAVAQRTREMGVRIALGATAGEVTRLVVGQGMTLAAAGAVLGLAGALVVTRLLQSLLYDVAPSDPVTLAGIVVVLVLSVLAASWLPARRAARIPVVQALRGG
jgi:predicted permease